MIVTIPAQAEPEWKIAFYDDIRIEVAAEGRGPLIVMLPSRGRGAEDFAFVVFQWLDPACDVARMLRTYADSEAGQFGITRAQWAALREDAPMTLTKDEVVQRYRRLCLDTVGYVQK